MSTSAAAMGILGVAISAAVGVGCCSCACVSGLAAAPGGGVIAVGAAFSGANGRTGSSAGSADASAVGRSPRWVCVGCPQAPSCQRRNGGRHDERNARESPHRKALVQWCSWPGCQGLVAKGVDANPAL